MGLIPMRNEPEKEKLLMNANPHDEPGTTQFGRDGGAAFEQRKVTWEAKDVAAKYAIMLPC